MRFIALSLLAILAVSGCNRGNQDALTDEQAGESRDSGSPEARCASRGTYDRIRAELFREAARIRGDDLDTFNQLAAHASLRVARPVVLRDEEEVGFVTCRARLTLDLPPGLVVAGGRRSLSAEADYAIQSAADETGDVITLTGADAILIPLATLSRQSEREPEDMGADQPAPVGEAEAIPDVPEAPDAPPARDPLAPRPQPAEPRTSSIRPSFNCAYASTRGELAVCSSPELAALDRSMAALYSGVMADADARTRSELLRTRDRFLAYRDRCPNSACIADAYRGRMLEIRDIAAAGSLRR